MKLNNIQKNFYIFFSVIISIFITTLLWGEINFPLNNTLGAKGLLVSQGYNPTNDTIRYIFFISVPLIVFLFFNYILKKKTLKIEELFFQKNEKIVSYYPSLIILSFIFIFFIFLEFFSLNFSDKKLDHFHDGTFLAPIQNYLTTNNFWVSSFLTHGGADVFYPLLSWKVFGVQTIGAARVFTIFLTLLLKISCVLLSYQLTKISNLNEKTKILFFSIFTVILISLSHYNIKAMGYYLSHRDIYIILFLICFIQLFIQSNLKYFFIILISIIATTSILFHIDTGIYINFILSFYFLYLIIIKKYKDILLIIVSLAFAWFIAIYIIGYDEFLAFLNNSKTIIFSMDLMHGMKYPEPFFSILENPDGARATRGLLLQLAAGLFVLNYLISDKIKISNSKKIFFIFLFLLSFVMYKNALGRSDAGHIRMSNDLPILINSFFILNYFFIFVEKNIFIKKNLSKNTFFFISLFFLMCFYILNASHYKIMNIKNFNDNFINYINLKDEEFLDKKTIELVSFYKQVSEEDRCVANISYDDAFSYLLKKPTCTKYWSAWLTSPIVTQIDYIAQFQRNSPKYILYDNKSESVFEGYTIYERIELINSYILNNYAKHKEFAGYLILKKR